MLHVFQLLFVLFALFAIVGVVQKKRQGDLGPRGALFWSLFWLAVAIAVMWPDSTERLAHLFGIGRGVDFVFYIAIATMFYLLFKLHIKVEHTQRTITRVVREQALRVHDKK